MPENVLVSPDQLTLYAAEIASLAEQVRSQGRALTRVGRPVLGASEAADDLVNEVTTQVCSTATWVMTCASALAALATAGALAADTYRATEREATERWNSMSVAFEGFDQLYGLMTDPV